MTASLCSSFRPASRASASAASDAATFSRVAAQSSDRSAASIGRTLATAHDGFGGTAGSVGEWAYHRPVEPVDRREFEALVADALDALPPDLTGLMDNVVVLTADRGDPPDLLGLYDGVPLTEREDYGGLVLPDRIHVYRLALCEACADLDELRREVVVTVVHEVAHHFGIDDDTLDDLGWG